MMVKELRSTSVLLIHMAQRGQKDFTAKMIVADVLHPVLKVLKNMSDAKDGRWLTLTEAMRETQKTRNYFEKPLAALGQRSRLEAWRAEGFADRALAEDGSADGPWLISPLKIAESKNEAAPADESPEEETTDEVDRVVANLLKKKG